MKILLEKYCKLNSLKVIDMIGKSHAKGLSTHRHVFAYCVNKQYPNIRLWQIAKIINKKPPSVSYGIKLINGKLTPIVKNGVIVKPTPEIKYIAGKVLDFIKICKDVDSSDLVLPKKDKTA